MKDLEIYEKYVIDNDINRRLLTEKLGVPEFNVRDQYILINTTTKSWKSIFTFQLLYRNPPTLLSQDELIDLLQTL